jgi:flavin reductase (DIM6/NTAB) family NADH-FMN oxidoreductase RutF
MVATPPNFNADFFRSALGRFATGVTVITTENSTDQSPVGLTISSFNSVSLRPPMVLWSLSKAAGALVHFEQCQRYVIHVLSAPQLHLAKQFAAGPQSRRFTGLEVQRAPGGTPMLGGTAFAAWFECYNLTRHEAGDHIIFVGQVERCHRNFVQPLVYHAGDFDLTPSVEPLSSN